MKKEIILKIIFIGIFFLVFYLINSPIDSLQDITNDNSTNNSYNQSENNKPLIEDILPQRDFYYWESIPINYYFSMENPCNDNARRWNIQKAFRIIKQATNGTVQFQEKETNNAIEISCYEEYGEYVSQEINGEIVYSTGAITAGEGGIVSYVGEKEIINASILLYEQNPNYKSCNTYPSTEIHEILHALGFGHIDNNRSIMSPTAYYLCIELDSEIINCLQHIYGNSENGTCDEIPSIYN